MLARLSVDEQGNLLYSAWYRRLFRCEAGEWYAPYVALPPSATVSQMAIWTAPSGRSSR